METRRVHGKNISNSEMYKKIISIPNHFSEITTINSLGHICPEFSLYTFKLIYTSEYTSFCKIISPLICIRISDASVCIRISHDKFRISKSFSLAAQYFTVWMGHDLFNLFPPLMNT